MNPIYVLCEGGNVHPEGNKGDELMLHTVMHRLREINPEIRFVLPHFTGDFIYRARIGTYQLLWPGDWRSLSGTIGRVILNRFRESFGIVAEKELSWIVNFQGYRYADFGEDIVRKDYRNDLRRRRKGIRSIFLPQSYGPFNSLEVARMTRSILESAALVGVRDTESEEYLRDIGIPSDLMFKSPDITVDFACQTASTFSDMSERIVAIIPNIWMIERMPQVQSLQYITFLERVIKRLNEHGVKVELINHAPFQDDRVFNAWAEQVGRNFAPIAERSPVELKRRISRCLFVVGSRYHGLVAALSQNIPALATSWAHKYNGLYDDYGIENLLLSPDDDEDVLLTTLDRLCDQSTNDILRRQLALANERNHFRLNELWARVHQLMAGSV